MEMEKRAYTPAEFSQIFGHEKTWAYRLLYTGKIDGIRDCGRVLIPATQVARIENSATRYYPKKRRGKEAGKEDGGEKKLSVPPSSPKWTAWIERKKTGSARTKGLGSHARRVQD